MQTTLKFDRTKAPKGFVWMRPCRRCGLPKGMKGGVSRNNGRGWICADCRKAKEGK